MKKMLALLMAFLMLFSVATLISGCEDSGKKKSSSKTDDVDDVDDEDEEDEEDDGKEGNDEGSDKNSDDNNNDGNNNNNEDNTSTGDGDDGDQGGGTSYVLDLTFNKKDYDRISVSGMVYGTKFEYAYQTISENETLVYYSKGDSTVIYRDCDDKLDRYIVTAEGCYEDTEEYETIKRTDYIDVINDGDWFLRHSAWTFFATYKKIGTESHETFGTLYVYEVYDMNDELLYIYKLHSTGIMAYVLDAKGNVLAELENVATEGFDLTEIIG